MRYCKHIKKKDNKPYCKKQKSIITFAQCRDCENKEYKIKKKYKIKNRVSKQSKALDISQKVKKIVFERDEGKCVICGNTYNVMPNSHYIPRSKGGLGIEQNIFTACTNLTENKCHLRWEQNKCTSKEIKRVKDNFKIHYPKWKEKDLYYKKSI